VLKIQYPFLSAYANKCNIYICAFDNPGLQCPKMKASKHSRSQTSDHQGFCYQQGNKNLTSLRSESRKLILHTGQHYDREMSEVFFDELEIHKPHYNLGAGSSSHGRQTAFMLTGIEEVLCVRRNPIVWFFTATPIPPWQALLPPRNCISRLSTLKQGSEIVQQDECRRR
jgi:hypothetical protein